MTGDTWDISLIDINGGGAGGKARAIFPYDVTISTTPLALLSPVYKKIYYIVVSVKSMGTAQSVYIGNVDGQVLGLNNLFSYLEYEAPPNSFLDLTGMSARTDAGTAVLTIFGVAL
jgi:hypothetical protein